MPRAVFGVRCMRPIAPDDDFAPELRVAKRVPNALVPRRARHVDDGDRDGDDEADRDEPDQLSHDSSASTDFTNASSSSSDPVFLYAKSARFTFSLSGMNRDSRSSIATCDLALRSLDGAVMTTILSKRASPPVS